MTKVSVAFLFAAFAVSSSFGGAQARGVAGVDVVVKQNPSKRAVTDAGGNFAFDGLAPGAYVVSFRAPKSRGDTKSANTDKVTVATSYSIKIDGTKRPITQSGLTSDKLLGGVDVRVELGAGARIRGQVLAGGSKKMVWIPKELGSNIPGHWVEANSLEAKRFSTQTHTGDDMREMMPRANANMLDPMERRNDNPR
ncbi:MAG TPA: carboxypeptidase-like regulatory domain-containing protein [Chthoniobacterales bacterium]|nr:carboxypeptidase-like regulatory domain-containing protein [Chthoniobacterales bacterium]